jgi:ArsR family transcriptional regulator
MTADIERFADIFKALSNSNRLALMLRLVSFCEPGTVCTMDEVPGTCVGDLSRDLNISPSTVSHHLKELRRSGLIKSRRRGQRIECWVDAEVWRELSVFFMK